MKVCVVIPSFNEEKNIGILLERIKEKGLDVIVVDDGSEDKTYEECLKRKVTVIRNSINRGKGFSLRKGFKYAIERGYEIIITMDADGQHDPQELDKFIEKFNATKADLIIGNRMQNPENMPFIRKVTNIVMSLVISAIVGRKIEDSQCGYRLIKADTLKKVKLRSIHYEIESELIFKIALIGGKIEQVPIESIYRREVSKIDPFKDTLRFMKLLFRYFTRKNE